MRKAIFTYILILIPFTIIYADTDDIDSLFDDAVDIEVDDKGAGETEETGSDGSTSDSEKGGSDVLSNLIDTENFQFGASFDATVGYSPGWEIDPDPLFSDSALMLMSSKLTLDARVNDSFRFLQSYNVSFPAFEPVVSEFFADFDFGDRVYFRVGRQNLTWGISRYYKFSNLHARLPENFGYVYEYESEGIHSFDLNGYYQLSEIDPDDDISDYDSYSVKMDIPIGIGGFQGLIYGRNGFFADSSSPAVDELGWGGYFNLALKQADLTLGGYYHNDMNLRGFFSASTTLFNSLELYTEAVVSYDHGGDDLLPIDDDALPDGDGHYIPEADPDSLDFAANLGFYVDFFSGNLELSGEYFYNGEETELEPLGTKLGLPLIWGHNLAMGAGVNLLDKTLKIEAYTLYNIDENTGVLAPQIKWNGLGFLELRAAFPMIYGSDSGTYAVENPDALDRRYSFVLTAKVSGRI